MHVKRRYCVTRKEILAVVFFIQRFRHYLLGREFLLCTDHGSLTWLQQFKEAEYSFSICTEKPKT